MIEKLKASLMKLAGILRTHVVIIFFVIFGAMYGFLIFTSGQQAANTPSETQINEKLKTAKRPKVDENAAKTLEELRDQSIEVQALFNEARNNPFSE